MTHVSHADRRRLIDALGLGPVWVHRTVHEVDGDVADVDIATLDRESLQRMVVSGRACGLSVDAGGLHASQPDWLVVGAPADGGGSDAFAGDTGRLLDAMLAAIGLRRDETVLVASLLNSRGSAAASPVLARQLELLAPSIVLIVGDEACSALVPDAPGVEALRGKRHDLTIAGTVIPAIVTFHPARLLDDGAAKALAWADLCLARTTIDAMVTAAVA